MSAFLSDNAAVLTRRWPGLAERIAKQPETRADVEIIYARSGLPTVRYGGQLLHSRFDPVHEADRLLEKAAPKESGGIVILGFGLGYHVESAVRYSPDQPILVVEPDVGLFATALATRPLAILLNHPHLHIHVAEIPAGVDEAAQSMALDDPTIIPLRPVVLSFPEYFQDIRRLLTGLMDRDRVNVNTLDRFGALWVRNLLHNLRTFHSSPGIAALGNSLMGIPALILAAGPSLDQVLPHIQALAERMAVIAVDTSLGTLLERGVEPDFTVVIDPQYWNSRHLDRVADGGGLVVSEPSTYPRALRLVGRSQFFMSSLFPLGQYLEALGIARGKLGAGGSVATTAWDLARVLGCQPIVMAGLDLGFPSRTTHFRGAFFETRFHQLSDRVTPSELLSFSYLYGADPYPVPSNDGGIVLTDRRMAIYAAWFATQAQIHPDVRTLTLSLEGVEIEGIAVTDRQSLMGYPVIRDQLNSIVRRLASATGDGNGRDWLPVCRSLQELAEDLGRIHRLAAEAVDLAEINSGRDMNRLDQIDQIVMGTDSRKIVGFLMQPLIHRIARGSGEHATDSGPMGRTAEIYRQIGRSARIHEDLIRTTLKRLPAS